MIRNLKATFSLGILAALAVTAFSAVSASGATSGHFTSSTANTVITGTEVTGGAHEMKISLLGITVSCHHPTYTGALTGTTTQSITMTPTYSNCTSGGGAALITMNGCAFIFTSRATGTGHATTHFECPVGKKAEVHTPNCTMTFGAQTTQGVTYANIPDGDITLTSTTTNIVNERHGICAIVDGPGPAADASLTGSVTISSVNEAHLTTT